MSRLYHEEPKICQECFCRPVATESDPFPDCGCEPRDCALAKARLVKKLRSEEKRTGVPLDTLWAEYEQRIEDEIVADMGHFADFMASQHAFAQAVHLK